jgi:hypothetical protein
MVLDIQEAGGRLKITAKREINWADLVYGILIFVLLLWEPLVKLRPVPFICLGVGALLWLSNFLTGDQLEIAGGKLIHRIGLFGFRVPNRTLYLEKAQTMGYSFRRRWFGLFPDDTGFLMKFADYKLYFGHRMKQSDVAEIMSAIEHFRSSSSEN